MPKTESKMLFYRKAFSVLPVGGLCCNLATMEVSWPMKNRRVSQLSTKGWLSRTRGPLLLLSSSPEELFYFLSLRRVCSFSLHLPCHRPADCQYILCSILFYFLLVAKVLTPPFLKRFKSLFANLVSIKLVTFAAIYPKRFVFIVVYLSLQQTSATPCRALDVLMFAKDSR